MTSFIKTHKRYVQRVLVNRGNDQFAFYPFKGNGIWKMISSNGIEKDYPEKEIFFNFGDETAILDLKYGVWYTPEHQGLSMSHQQKFYQELGKLIFESNPNLRKVKENSKLISFALSQIIPKIKVPNPYER